MQQSGKSTRQVFLTSIWMFIGAFLASFALEVFLIPNQIIDGGVVGISILLSDFFGPRWLYPTVGLLNLPFLFIAYRNVGKWLVSQMLASLAVFVTFGVIIRESHLAVFQPYRGDLLEIVVIGGMILGLGVGLIIRWGGCLDGTEILGILLSKKYGLTVGNIVLMANAVIFTIAGFVYGDWHPSIKSLITFFIVIKVMDQVIMGFDEMKSITIITTSPKRVAEALMHELGLGLTIIHGQGGYTGEAREILYLIAERLQLSEIKALVHEEDNQAFIAIENLHEVSAHRPDMVSLKTPVTPRKRRTKKR